MTTANETPKVETPVANQNSEDHACNLDISLNDDIKLSSLEKFPSLRKGEVARFAIVSFDAQNTPKIKMSQYFFDSENKLGFLAPKNKETLAKIIGRLGEPKVKFGTIVIKYETDTRGNLLGTPDKPAGFTYYAWLFSTDKFNPLKTLHKEWNLCGRDIIATCDDEQYQKWVLAPAQDCVMTHYPNAAEILETGTQLYNNCLLRFFNREIPDNEIMIKLGLVSGPAPMVAASPFNPARALPAANPTNAFSTLVKNSGNPK